MSGMLDWKPHDKEQKSKPGPGSYNHNKLALMSKSVVAKIGRGTRLDLATSQQMKYMQSPAAYMP